MTPFKIIPLLTLFPIITLLSQKKHLLMMLLSLEVIILSLTFNLSMLTLSMKMMNLFIPLFFLALGACEAALGLALLLMMSRTYGSDMINSLSINKC